MAAAQQCTWARPSAIPSLLKRSFILFIYLSLRSVYLVIIVLLFSCLQRRQTFNVRDCIVTYLFDMSNLKDLAENIYIILYYIILIQ